jgi:hypothetical protein
MKNPRSIDRCLGEVSRRRGRRRKNPRIVFHSLDGKQELVGKDFATLEEAKAQARRMNQQFRKMGGNRDPYHVGLTRRTDDRRRNPKRRRRNPPRRSIREAVRKSAGTVGPFEHGYGDAGALAGRSEMPPQHRANLLYPGSKAHRVQYVDGWRMAEREIRHGNPRSHLFKLLAQRNGGRPLVYLGGVKFAERGSPAYFRSKEGARTVAKLLRLQFPMLKRYAFAVQSA